MHTTHAPYDDPELWDEYKNVVGMGDGSPSGNAKSSEGRMSAAARWRFGSTGSQTEASVGGACPPLEKAKDALVKASQQTEPHGTLRYLRMAEWMLARPASWFAPEDSRKMQEMAQRVRIMIGTVEDQMVQQETQRSVSIFSRI
jgi:hypothetical protein